MRFATLITILFSIFSSVLAQNTVSGRIIDSDENPISGVKIIETETRNKTFSNADGSYRLAYFSNENKMVLTHPRYDTLVLPFTGVDGQTIFMLLREGGNDYNLDYYVGYTDFSIKNPNKRLENMPYFFGEADINRQLQMLPGVEHGTEVLSNLYVRGGDVDQNLMTYNGSPIYNYNHLFGLTNIFHHRSIANTGLYKGLAPAAEGGRISSIIDLESAKDAEFSGMDGEVEITPLNAGIFVESINKGKNYFTLAARRSWYDILLLPEETRANDLNFNYYDLQVNGGFKVGDNDMLELSLLSTKDLYMTAFQYDADSTNLNAGRFRIRYSWKNLVGSVKYKQHINEDMNATHSLHYSGYGFSTQLSDEVFNTNGDPNPYSEDNYSSGVKDIIGKSIWEYQINNINRLDLGVQANVRLFNLGQEQRISRNFIGSEDENYIVGNTSATPSTEIALFGEEHIWLSDQFRLDAGVRAVYYFIDSFNQIALEPRIHCVYNLDSASALKFGYNRANQFVRQLNTGGSGDPTNLWVPATELVRPMQADIVEVGYERLFGSEFVVSANAYFKQMSNLTQINNFSNAINPENDWQSEIFVGSGSAYGIEIMAQKNKGILTGFASYTLSRSNRDFPDLSSDPFLFTFDRTHLGKMYFNVETDGWNFGANFLIGSGRLFTVPIGKFYDINNQLQLEYNTLNNYRSDMYHRLDLSVVKRKNFISYEQQWKFFLFNVTGARNPIFINAEFEDNSFTNLLVSRQYLAFIPGISYTLLF